MWPGVHAKGKGAAPAQGPPLGSPEPGWSPSWLPGALPPPGGDDTKSSRALGTLTYFFLKLQEHSLIRDATTPGKPQRGRYSHRYAHRDPCSVISVIFWIDAILGN